MRKLVPLLFGIAAFAPVMFAATTGYHLLGEIKVGGEGGWDYLAVDATARRLYVSHATHVAVIDIDAGKVVGDIPDTPGVHGIAIAPDEKSHRVYLPTAKTAPAAAGARPTYLPDTFKVLIVGK